MGLCDTAPVQGWPNFQVHPLAFSEPECARILSIGHDAVVAGAEEAGIEGVEDPGALRRTQVAWIPREPATEWVYERLEALGRGANEAWGLDLDGIDEELQFTLYEGPGAHYTWHHDGLEVGVADRKVSVVVQLDDPQLYRGADLEFLEVATDYDPAEREAYLDQVRARGTAVSFCSFEYHRVTRLVSGRRRSLVAWLSGPPLR